MRRRNRRFELRLTEADIVEITSKAQKAGISNAELVRRAVRGAEIRAAPSADVAELIVQIRRVGYNINGLLRIANAQKLVEVPDLQKALEKLGRVAQLISEAYTK